MIRLFRVSVFMLVIFAVVISYTSLVMAQDTGVTATVSAAIVSLQAGPGLDFSSVGTAKLNQKFPVLGRARGSKRVWYKVQLPDGTTAWLSERIVNIDPSPDDLPWLGDNAAKTPLAMDCGTVRPTLFVGGYAQITSAKGVLLTRESGIGKRQVGSAAVNALVKVLDGPFCTLISTGRYQIEWLVINQSGVIGYMLEGLPNGQGPYIKLTTKASDSDFPPSTVTPDPNASSVTDRPSYVSDDDIAAVMDIFDNVQRKKINEKQATDRLQAVIEGRNPAILVWIVRRVPIYDGKTRGWVSLARYEDQSLMEFKLNSQLDQDPVQTTITILFGKYKDETEEFQDIGCGG